MLPLSSLRFCSPSTISPLDSSHFFGAAIHSRHFVSLATSYNAVMKSIWGSTLIRTGKSARGFTLIELLVVIAIIGILSSVVLASLNSARKKGRDARRIADLKQLQLALELYYDANPSTGQPCDPRLYIGHPVGSERRHCRLWICADWNWVWLLPRRDLGDSGPDECSLERQRYCPSGHHQRRCNELQCVSWHRNGGSLLRRSVVRFLRKAYKTPLWGVLCAIYSLR